MLQVYCSIKDYNLWLYLCFYFSPLVSDYDVFNEGKTLSFFESQQAVMTLCTYMESINKQMEELSKNQLFEHFNKLLQVSIFNTSSIHDNLVSVLINILVSTMVQLIMCNVYWLLVVTKHSILQFPSALQSILVSYSWFLFFLLQPTTLLFWSHSSHSVFTAETAGSEKALKTDHTLFTLQNNTQTKLSVSWWPQWSL